MSVEKTNEPVESGAREDLPNRWLGILVIMLAGTTALLRLYEMVSTGEWDARQFGTSAILIYLGIGLSVRLPPPRKRILDGVGLALALAIVVDLVVRWWA